MVRSFIPVITLFGVGVSAVAVQQQATAASAPVVALLPEATMVAPLSDAAMGSPDIDRLAAAASGPITASGPILPLAINDPLTTPSFFDPGNIAFAAGAAAGAVTTKQAADPAPDAGNAGNAGGAAGAAGPGGDAGPGGNAGAAAGGGAPSAGGEEGSDAGISPLTTKRFDFDNLPYQVDTDIGKRGGQFGYNQCNSTTEGPESRCQTALINSVADFCLWGGPKPNSIVGNTEGESVAWCTQPKHGARLIPPGTITGVQFIRTPDYIQVTGVIKQEFINLAATDSGGEMDPHGADERGNPLGGIVFTNAFASLAGNNATYVQAIEWHNFMGSNRFCFKACDPAGPNPAGYCQHIFDRIGCEYNAPASYADKVFESCEGESQDPPGVYESGGQTLTYQQPPESVAIGSLPYTARLPKTSNCVKYESLSIYPTPIPVSTVFNTVTAAPTSTGAPGSNGKPDNNLSQNTASGTTVSGAVAMTLLAGAIAFISMF